MKLTLLLCVVLACTLCGQALSGAAERRRKMLEELLRALRTLRIQIFNLLEPLQTALTQTKYPLFAETARNLSREGSVGETWRLVRKEACMKGKYADCLTACDIAALDRLFDQLGGSGLETQNEAISVCIMSVEELLSDSKKHCAQVGRLYTSIGFLTGLGAAILMI